jgi:pyruvate formate lyase activating enzyme
MDIHGLQKMTLLDYPGNVACTVFLGGCNFRCPFCHNWEIVDGSMPSIMSKGELLSFLEKRINLLDGVVITGGEPTLRNDLPDLIREIKDMGFKVKLDTNGNNPDRLINLVENGLVNYVAMDIKNGKSRYGETVGIKDFDISPIEESVNFLLKNKVQYEFRTTVIKQFHDEESFMQIAEWINGADKYFLQGFIDRETVPYKGLEAYDVSMMHKFLDIVKPSVKVAELRGVK